MEFLIRYGRLGRSGSVLDIGCGSGRIAEPLSCYLSSEGVYRGFDLTETQIQRCRDIVRHPGFKFETIDIWHPLYNPEGKVAPSDFEFPYEDKQFDVVFAASIFSHLSKEVATDYLQEIARVLKPNGRAILSFFRVPKSECREMGGITNQLGSEEEGVYSYRFVKQAKGYYVHCDRRGTPKCHYHKDSPGDPVAYDLEELEEMAAGCSLSCSHFLEGAWRFTKYVHGWQDMLILQR